MDTRCNQIEEKKGIEPSGMRDKTMFSLGGGKGHQELHINFNPESIPETAYYLSRDSCLR